MEVGGYHGSRVVLGKREREEEKEKGVEGEESESITFPPAAKKLRKNLSERMHHFKESPIPLNQAKKFKNLAKIAQEYLDIVQYSRQLHFNMAIEEAKKEWAELGEDPDAWERAIFKEGVDPQYGMSFQDRISKQFKLIMHSDVRNKHFPQLQIIFAIFMRNSHSTEPKALKRITDCTPMFERINALYVEKIITFSIAGTHFYLPQSCLLRCGSSYFNDLFNKDFMSDSNNYLEPVELNIDKDHYQILDAWLREPSLKPFVNRAVQEILNFLVSVHQFDIPQLVSHCDQEISNRITKENVLDFLEQIYRFVKEKREQGISFHFPLTENKLVQELESHHLCISSEISKKANWFFGTETPIKIKLKVEPSKLNIALFKIQNITIFKDLKNIELDISTLHRLRLIIEDMNLPVSCFPNTKKIVIYYKCEKSKDKSLTNWDYFLNKFKNLEKIHILLPTPLNPNFFRCFTNFQGDKKWCISFEMDPFFEVGGTPLSADHYIKLKILESSPTICQEWPVILKPEINEDHFKKLLEAKKFNLESSLLDLENIKLPKETLKHILSQMPKLEELKFNLSYPDLIDIVGSLPRCAQGLQKLTLPLSFFRLDGWKQSIINFQNGKFKELNILVDSGLQPIPYLICIFLKEFKLLGVKFQFPQADLTQIKNVFKIKLENHVANHKINETMESRKHLTGISQLLQNFKKFPIILDIRDIQYSSSHLTSLSQLFPYISLLLVGSDDFEPLTLKGFYQLKLLHFPTSNFIKILSPPHLENLKNYPVDIVINDLDSDHLLRESFMRNLIEIKDLLPNFQTLSHLKPEQIASMTDGELRALFPKKCHTTLNLNGMHQISSRVILDILSDFPNYHCLLNISNCQRIKNEIRQGNLPLDDFIQLVTLPHQSTGKFLFQGMFPHYRKRLTDQHIDKLLMAKKIPNATIDLCDMPLVGEATFLKLLREVNPRTLIMGNNPNLLSALPSGASHIKERLSLPFDKMKEKDFRKTLLENFLEKGTTKYLMTKCDISDFKSIDEQLITEVSHQNLRIIFDSAEIKFTIQSSQYDIIFYSKAHSLLTKESLYLDLLSKLTNHPSKMGEISYEVANEHSSEHAKMLEAIIHHFSSHKAFNLEIKFNEEMLADQKNFAPLLYAKNMKCLKLEGDEKLLPGTPALTLLQALPQDIKIINNAPNQIQDLETYVQRSEFIRTLFPHRHPFSLLEMSNQIRAQITDEVLLRFKVKSNIVNWYFRGMAKITLKGILNYLQGNNFESLNFRGCQTALSEGVIEHFKNFFPNVKIEV